MRIVIIGAGVAGSIMARGLAGMPGIEVHCLERIRPGGHAESGTGLNIGPNAVTALIRTDPETARGVDGVSLPWASWRTSTMGGRELFNLRLKDVAPVDGWRLRWAELYSVLRNSAGPAIRYGCSIERIAPVGDGTGRINLSYADAAGSHDLNNVDLLIAADGRFSQVRQYFQGPVNARQVGVAIFRLLVPDTTGGLIDDYEQWFNGPNRLLGYRVPGDSIYMSGTFPIPIGSEISETAKTREALRHAYTPADGTLSDQGEWLVGLVSDPAVELHWARLQESPMCVREEAANVLYVGDSSNGMVPTLGQGATQAIEGACAALDTIRALVDAGRFDPAEWLDEIATARADRLRFVMDFSLEASDTLLEGADPVAGTLKKREPGFMAKLHELYNHSPEARLVRAAG